jgi:probable phosphoglycerate mutase
MSALLLLVRHGETDWNAEGRSQGQDGPGLNDRGRSQAEETARRLLGRPLAALYSSDLPRALETARIVAQTLGGLEVRRDPRLRERHGGVFQGLLGDEIAARFPDHVAALRVDPLDSAPPGGETLRQTARRAQQALDEIAARHPDRQVGVVSHGGLIGVLRFLRGDHSAARFWELIPDNAEVVEMTWPAADGSDRVGL